MTFHNTNNESGRELQESATQAKYQQGIILEYFKLHPDKEFTPFEIQSAVGLVATPITSIRRAVTNLTTDDKLIKTDNQRVGQYGKKNYCWRLNIGNNNKECDNNGNPDIYNILEQEKKFQASICGEPTGRHNSIKTNEKQQKLFL